MLENYLISIIGRQKIDDETGEIELTTLGSYVKKGNSQYIVYKEYDADNHNAAQTSVLKVDGNSKVTLMRGGADSTRLILENGKRHLCQYDTGFGNMMVGVFTSRVKSSLGEMGGNLEVNYTLDINSNLSSLNELFITVKEANNKDVKNSVTGDQ
ncbi:DUF1934 domain-containing protein [Caproiciproducens faecalis]|uniref:DUF1934 domain-containing protein n=1 Tax=Caproiciproducens faecalis TaxID=2820301 RepID=A0ABS7DKG1_9FIRM|nr:DUF1934 domain-containing protein [Caproiciproducens faecalis]MBW7571604.1 DUF1934 domain-containing protein [Caproiciproducens faecalis]